VIGIAWLFLRRNNVAAVAAMFPIAYFIASGGVNTPYVRYAVPLVPALAITAAVLSADLLRMPRMRRLAQFTVLVAMVTTGLYAVAYMNVYRRSDSRLQASQWLIDNVPAGSHVMIEPSQRIDCSTWQRGLRPRLRPVRTSAHEPRPT
jgi:4-amino-4-deoxy-L-arabinose transferase-like glycosyltransferase